MAEFMTYRIKVEGIEEAKAALREIAAGAGLSMPPVAHEVGAFVIALNRSAEVRWMCDKCGSEPSAADDGDPCVFCDGCYTQVPSDEAAPLRAKAEEVYASCAIPPGWLDPPRHTATCPRCAGPATALLMSVACERPGGCKTVDERIGEPHVVQVSPRYTTVYNRRTKCEERVMVAESCWLAASSGRERAFANATHPTKLGAIALWREAAIAAERGK